MPTNMSTITMARFSSGCHCWCMNPFGIISVWASSISTTLFGKTVFFKKYHFSMKMWFLSPGTVFLKTQKHANCRFFWLSVLGFCGPVVEDAMISLDVWDVPSGRQTVPFLLQRNGNFPSLCRSFDVSGSLLGFSLGEKMIEWHRKKGGGRGVKMLTRVLTTVRFLLYS